MGLLSHVKIFNEMRLILVVNPELITHNSHLQECGHPSVLHYHVAWLVSPGQSRLGVGGFTVGDPRHKCVNVRAEIGIKPEEKWWTLKVLILCSSTFPHRPPPLLFFLTFQCVRAALMIRIYFFDLPPPPSFLGSSPQIPLPAALIWSPLFV